MKVLKLEPTNLHTKNAMFVLVKLQSWLLVFRKPSRTKEFLQEISSSKLANFNKFRFTLCSKTSNFWFHFMSVLNTI